MAIRVVLEVPKRKRRERWRAQGDELRTFLGDFAASLTQASSKLDSTSCVTKSSGPKILFERKSISRSLCFEERQFL
jgi:hypothetical protein